MPEDESPVTVNNLATQWKTLWLSYMGLCFVQGWNRKVPDAYGLNMEKNHLHTGSERLLSERELLMIPGPTNVDPKVLRMLARNTVSHVGATFAEIHKEAIQNMKKVFMTNGEVFIVCGSGTLAMEMTVANFVEPGDKVLVVCNGYFGERFALICERHRAVVTRLNIEWGRVADPQAIKEELEKDDFKALFVVHVDTSTGAANRIKEIGDVTSNFNTLYVLDTVCSLGGMEVRVDDWHIDVCLTGSQKALAIPPGLALMAVGEKALEAYRQRKQPVDFYYGDIQNWTPIMKEPTKYFATPAVNMVYALNESLKMILAEGLEARFHRHKTIAKAFRAALKAQELKLVTEEAYAADTMSAIMYPEGVDDASFRSILANEFRVIVAGGLGPLAGKSFRVGHMGNVSVNDITATIGAIEIALAKIGVPLDVGRGIEAAEKILSKS